MAWDMLLKEAMEINTKISDGNINMAVVGVGGAGSNTVNNLSKRQTTNVKLMAINTDLLSLQNNGAEIKLIIGKKYLKGESTAGDVEKGLKAAEFSEKEIREKVEGFDIVFVIAGLGGGTGGGAGPKVAEIARSTGALTVSVVSLPFLAEGPLKQEKAKVSLERFYKSSDTVIVLDNNVLLKIVPNLPLRKAFGVMDTLISDIINNIAETVNKPSIMRIDFADLSRLMKKGGASTIMYGEGELRDLRYVIDETLNNKFYNVDHTTAKGALIHITGGPDLSLNAMNLIVESLTEGLDSNAEIKVGTRIKEDMMNRVSITAIFTNIEGAYGRKKVSLVKESALMDVDSIYP